MGKKIVIKLVLELPDDANVSIVQSDCEMHGEARDRINGSAEKIREGKPKRIPVAKLEELVGPEIDGDNKLRLI